MSQHFKRSTYAFIVRFWSESKEESIDGNLAGQVERVGSGEKAHFRGASGLLKLLERWTPNFKANDINPEEEEDAET